MFRLHFQTAAANNTSASHNDNNDSKDDHKSTIEIRKRHPLWSQGTNRTDEFEKVRVCLVQMQIYRLLSLWQDRSTAKVQNPGYQPAMMCNSKGVKDGMMVFRGGQEFLKTDSGVKPNK